MLALKVLVVGRGERSGRHLPLLGLTVFGPFVVTWVTSAGDYLWEGCRCPNERRSYGVQVIGSLVVAVVIVLLTVALVTANLGAGVETREREEEREELLDEQEDRLDAREDRPEEEREPLDDAND